MSSPALHCSFCGAHHTDVAALIKGQTSAFICDTCVGECVSQIAHELRQAKGLPPLAPVEGAPR